MDDLLDDSELNFLKDLDKKSDEELKDEEAFIKELFDNMLGMLSLADKLSTKIHELSETYSNTTSTQDTKQIEEKTKEIALNYSKVADQINKDVITIYDFTNKINYFWHNCSIETYITNFPTLKERYLEKYKVATPLDLIKSEYEYYLIGEHIDTNVAHQLIRGNDYLSMLNYLKFLTYDNREFFKLVNKRKLEFLEKELDKLGYTVEVDITGEKPTAKFIDAVATVENDLTLSGLPKFNVQQRYEIFKNLGLEDIISGTKFQHLSEGAKHKLLAVILNISPDNTKKLYNNSYKPLTSDKEKMVIDFLEKQGVTKKE